MELKEFARERRQSWRLGEVSPFSQEAELQAMLDAFEEIANKIERINNGLEIIESCLRQVDKRLEEMPETVALSFHRRSLLSNPFGRRRTGAD